MLKDNHMGIVIATLMYVMHKRALMYELEELGSPCKQWLDRQLLSTSWPSVDFMHLMGFRSMSSITLALIGMQDPR
jgi:hypothetical protein